MEAKFTMTIDLNSNPAVWPVMITVKYHDGERSFTGNTVASVMKQVSEFIVCYLKWEEK